MAEEPEEGVATKENILCPKCQKPLAQATNVFSHSIELELLTNKLKVDYRSSRPKLVCDCGEEVLINSAGIISQFYAYCEEGDHLVRKEEIIDLGQSTICKACDERLAKEMKEILKGVKFIET